MKQRIESTSQFYLPGRIGDKPKRNKGATDKKATAEKPDREDKSEQPETPPKPLVDGALATVTAVPIWFLNLKQSARVFSTE